MSAKPIIKTRKFLLDQGILQPEERVLLAQLYPGRFIELENQILEVLVDNPPEFFSTHGVLSHQETGH